MKRRGRSYRGGPSDFLARGLLSRFNMKRSALILLGLLLFAVPETGAQTAPKFQSCTHTIKAKIVRSAKVRREFIRRHPCPAFNVQRSTFPRSKVCPGFEVDHVIPLHCGGRDVPENLQWLTVAEHRAKTKRDAACRR